MVGLKMEGDSKGKDKDIWRTPPMTYLTIENNNPNTHTVFSIKSDMGQTAFAILAIFKFTSCHISD